MKKTAMLCVLALLLGCTAGLLVNIGILDGRGLLSPPAPATTPAGVTSAPLLPVEEAFDTADNGPLLEAGDMVLEALKAGDTAALAALVDPDLGVTFTPYSTVDHGHDLTFLPDQLSQAGASETRYVWGYTQGKGDSISLTLPEYMDRYVFNTDYTRAPVIGVDRVLSSGNSLENVSDAYPGARFVEYYFPELDPGSGGLDWCSLKLVFQARDRAYRLVGIIHGEWTI